MTDREATMKAYNALHFNLPVIEDYGSKEQLEVQHSAINALDHALAQEQTKCPRCGEVNPAEIHTCSPQVAQPEQKPVAYLYHDTACAELANPLADSTLLVLACDRKPNGRNETPLYTAPPSKPWVSLTDDQRRDIKGRWVCGEFESFDDCLNVFEAALRSKNDPTSN